MSDEYPRKPRILQTPGRTIRQAFARLGKAGPSSSAAHQSTTRTVSQQACWMLGLHAQPFRDNAGAHELFVDSAIQMQLNTVIDQLRSGEMLPILRGEHGSGKTSMLIQLMARTGQRYHYFVVRGNASLSAERIVVDMLRVLVRPVPDKASECFRELVRQLRTLVADGRPAVLVADDAHALCDRELNRVLNVHDSLRSALPDGFRLLFAAEPELDLRLSNLDSQQLRSGEVFTANVRPFNRARMEAYLAHRLAMAGYDGSLPFDTDELDAIAQKSHGLPRSIEGAAATTINARWPD